MPVAYVCHCEGGMSPSDFDCPTHSPSLNRAYYKQEKVSLPVALCVYKYGEVRGEVQSRFYLIFLQENQLNEFQRVFFYFGIMHNLCSRQPRLRPEMSFKVLVPQRLFGGKGRFAVQLTCSLLVRTLLYKICGDDCIFLLST